MPHPTYNGQALPVYSVPPNWKGTVTLRLLYQTLIREALDLSEERQERQPRCLYGIRYQPLTLSGQETGYIRRVIEMAQALPVVMPVWTEACMILADAAAGATSLSVDDTTQTLFPVLFDYVFLFRDFKTWEVLEIDSVEGDEIILSEPTGLSWSTGDFVYPILIGKLPRANFKAVTDINALNDVDFEERFNGLTSQGTVEVQTPELEVEFLTACRDTFKVVTTVPDGETYILQAADSLEGPWGDHIFIEGDGTEQELLINNDYNGEKWFRLVNEVEEELVARPVNPQASAVAPPELVTISGAELSTRGLWGDEGLPYAYSLRENGFISNSETYVVPRGRWEYKSEVAGFGWDGVAQIPEITVEPGAVLKWTRDGSDPTEATVLPRLEGEEENIAAYRADFPFVLKIRAFKDGCRSPLTCILIDRIITGLGSFRSIGNSNTISAFCDLPRDNGVEAVASCEIAYGGVSNFDLLLRERAINEADTVTDGTTVYKLEDNPTTTSYIGFPIHSNIWGYYEHSQSEIRRFPVATWDSFPACFMFFYAQLSTEIAPTYKQPTSFGATMTTPNGLTGPFEGGLDEYILGNIPSGEDSAPVTLTVLDFVLTAHHDFVSVAESTFEPPDVEEPEPPFIAVNTIYGDNFETYLDGDAEAAPMDEGTGWADDWVFENYLDPKGFDDWEVNEDGDASEQELTGGEGWVFGSAWVINDYTLNTVGGDDFQSYTDGEPSNEALLDGGEGWAGPWWIQDYETYFSGGDDFQSYTDGVVGGMGGAEVTTLADGLGWDTGGAWHVFDYDATPANAASFLYYRIIVFKNNGDSGFTGILEFQLREAALGTNYAAASNGGAATSSANDASGPPAEAIDGLLTSGNGWVVAVSNLPAWLSVQLSTARVITEYTVGSYSTSSSTAARSANTWIVEGSNDGVTWTPLRFVNGEAGWTFGQMRAFNL